MGNIVSRIYDWTDCFYESYYPKSKYLQPVYFSSTLMTSYIALKFFAKKALPESYLCPEPYNTLTFLLCTGANLGIQLWVTFVSGTTMMRILPRHQNGLVQRHLFPKYMFLTSLFTFGSLSSFLNMKPSSSWTNDALTMGTLLTTSFVLNIVNFTCFNVGAIKYNQQMHEIEKNAGEGITTVGKLIQENKVKNDPNYQAASKQFWKFHGMASASNITSLLCTVGQFYLMAKKASFSF